MLFRFLGIHCRHMCYGSLFFPYSTCVTVLLYSLWAYGLRCLIFTVGTYFTVLGIQCRHMFYSFLFFTVGTCYGSLVFTVNTCVTVPWYLL